MEVTEWRVLSVENPVYYCPHAHRLDGWRKFISLRVVDIFSIFSIQSENFSDLPWVTSLRINSALRDFFFTHTATVFSPVILSTVIFLPFPAGMYVYVVMYNCWVATPMLQTEDLIWPVCIHAQGTLCPCMFDVKGKKCFFVVFASYIDFVLNRWGLYRYFHKTTYTAVKHAMWTQMWYHNTFESKHILL